MLELGLETPRVELGGLPRQGTARSEEGPGYEWREARRRRAGLVVGVVSTGGPLMEG